MRKNKEAYASLMTEEMGKPIKQAKAEVEKCAWVCDYYAENAAYFLQDEMIRTEAKKSFIAFRPLGVVLAIMPWNFPFWQVFRFAAPALMAGNGVLLKHSSNVSGCSLALEEIFELSGFPKGLFRSLLIRAEKVSDVIRHKFVQAVTLTGSTLAGRSVASIAGSVLKKTVLELGGSDPYVILEDADLDKAVKLCVAAKLLNGGQSCIAAKRFVVVDKIYEAFVAKFVEEMKSKKMGNPRDEKNDLGPQARPELRDELHAQVLKSVAMGARLLLGGEIPPIHGAYYPPTILVDVDQGMPAFDEEIFGPVAAIIKVKDEEEAIKTANHSDFGLGAVVFTSDEGKGEKIAKYELEAGCCFVNDFVKSDPRLPFGGIKQSGYGRELSLLGIREFVNSKTVVVQS